MTDITYEANLTPCPDCGGFLRLGAHGVGHDTERSIKLRAEVERDIERTIRDMGWPNRSVKRQNDNRRHALYFLRNAVATVIADDIAHGETPWPGTVEKYSYLTTLTNDK